MLKKTEELLIERGFEMVHKIAVPVRDLRFVFDLPGGDSGCELNANRSATWLDSLDRPEEFIFDGPDRANENG